MCLNFDFKPSDAIRDVPMQFASYHGVQYRKVAMPWQATLNERVGIYADDHADA